MTWYQAHDKIFASKLTVHEKVVMWTFYRWTHDNKACWYSVPKIAQAVSLSVRTCQRVLRALTDKKVLEVQYRKDNSSVYVLRLENLSGDTETPGGDTETPGGDTETPGGDTETPHVVTNRHPIVGDLDCGSMIVGQYISPILPLEILPEKEFNDMHGEHPSPTQAPFGPEPSSRGQTEPGEVVTPSSPASRSNPGFEVPLESLAAQAVWQEHRKHHPKVDEKPSKAVYGIVKSAYKLLSGEHASKVEQLVLLVEAANCCPDRMFSYDIRAIGWDGGTDRSGDLDTIFRHKRIPARLQAAKEWAEKGKLKENFFDNFTKKPQHNANSPPSENHFLNSLFGAKKPKNLQVVDAEFQTIQNTFFQIAED